MNILSLSQCNVLCGSGSQRRDIICVQKTENDFTVVPAAECAHLDKPAAVQECHMGACRPQWFTTEWSAVRDGREGGGGSGGGAKCVTFYNKSTFSPQTSRLGSGVNDIILRILQISDGRTKTLMERTQK